MPAAPMFIEVVVKPNARHSRLTQGDDGRWTAQLKAAPVQGRANAELVALVAGHFGCAKTAVSVKSGAGGRRKLLKISPG